MSSLQGITTAIMTPIHKDGSFDAESFDRLLDYVLGGGIHSIFVLGVAGEFASFSPGTRKMVVDSAVKKLKGRVPLIVGVSGDSVRLVLENIETYATKDADYVLATPSNFLPLSPAASREFFQTIADQSPLPLIIYNCPLNRNYIEPETMATLADHPNIAGLKETSTMIKLLQMYLKVGQRDDFVVMSGWEHLFIPALSIGIDAFTMGGPGNLLPGYCREVFDLYRQGQHGAARDRFFAVTRFLDEIFSIPPGALSAMKAVLSLLGLTQKYMAAPTETATDAQLDFIRQAMVRSALFPGFDKSA